MRLALYNEWLHMWWLLPILGIHGVLVFYVEFTFLPALVFLFVGLIVYRIATERQTETELLELSLPISREEWIRARFLSHFILVTAFAIVTYVIMTLKYYFFNGLHSNALPPFPVVTIWWGVALLVMSIIFFIFLRFSTNWAIIILGLTYAGLVVIMIAGSQASEPASSSIDASFTLQAITIAFATIGFIAYVLSFLMSIRHIRNVSIGTKR